MNVTASQAYSSLWNTRPAQQQTKIDNPGKLEQSTVQKVDLPDLSTAQTVSRAPEAAGVSTTNDNLTETLTNAMEAMSANSGVSPISYSTDINELYRFFNKYVYGTSDNTWVNIDQPDSNGVKDGDWSRAEIQAYADAYTRATGRDFDVDAFMEEYGYRDGNGDLTGVVSYDGQTRAYADDALGLGYAKSAMRIAEANAPDLANSNGATPTYDKNALNELVRQFTYGYGNSMQVTLDLNKDGVWTVDELQKYAKQYEKATGLKLDVEGIMAKYDQDGNGVLTYKEINAIRKDDALGLSNIKDGLAEIEAKESQGSGSSTGTSGITGSIKDQIGSAKLNSLAKAFSQSLQKSAMLDAFMMTNFAINNKYTYWNRSYGMVSPYQNLWNSHNVGLLNLFA